MCARQQRRGVAGCQTVGRGINQEMVGKLKWGGGWGWGGGVDTASLDCERLSLPLHSPLAPIGVLSSPSTPAETQTAREREKGGKSAGGIAAEHQRLTGVEVVVGVGG